MKKKLIAVICLVFLFVSACVSSEKVKHKDEPTRDVQVDNPTKEDPKADMGFANGEDHDEKQAQINGVAIGDKVKISLPQSLQETNYYCGPACLQMILANFGIQVSQSELAKQIKTDPITGSEYEDMVRVLNAYLFSNVDLSHSGYRVQTHKRSDEKASALVQFESRVRKNIDDGYPSVIAIDLNKIYPQLPSANHVVVCNGYIKKFNSEEIAFYYIVDPYDKVQDATHGGLKVVTPQELIDAIIDNVEPAYIW